MPLQHFLKQYFSENKKHGSKDRKWISHFCYSFYRLGKALSNMETDEKLRIAVYLCTEDLSPLGNYFPENWAKTNALDEKIQYVETQYGFRLEEIFPFRELLMPDIDFLELNKSFLKQPDVFLRIRLRRQAAVTEALRKSNIDFSKEGENAVRIKGRVAVDQVLQVNKDVVVQDLHSQAIATLLPDGNIGSIWDCCAASGGKTLLVRDQYPKARIVVSDVRESMLQNHKKRMQEAGVNVQQYRVLDLTKPVEDLKQKFDLIICDAPCSGAGTWARTPEEMSFFEKDALTPLHQLQLTIVQRIFGLLKENGYLLYITCSLFSEEDDWIIQQLVEKLPVSIEKQQLFIGTDKRADTMFGCLLKRTE